MFNRQGVCAWMFTIAVAAAQQPAATVKITPLGSHDGEFCTNDRALLFEDPTGVRVLYDPGRTISGGTDSRLGSVHVVLLSHAHVDHIGEVRPNPDSPGTCASPGTVSAAPNSNLADIVAAKNSAFFAGGELQTWVGRKVQDILGSATAACPAAGLDNSLTAPLSAPCTAALRPGGSRTVKLAGATAGVRFAAVAAFHSNGVPAAFTDSPGLAPGTAAYGGSETGFILTFTNGLTVYLTGDTGMFGDMSTIIRGYYHPSLMVANISDTVTLGPDEAAFAVQSLVRPRTVIPSHINEAATSGGLPVGARMNRFLGDMALSSVGVLLPLSGVTLQFDGDGNCVSCQ
jgi:L-ascorbate metabolism protein UlaG (beta-lactamase superfamily)